VRGKLAPVALLLILCLGVSSCASRREGVRVATDGEELLPSPPLDMQQVDRAVSAGCAYLLKRQDRQGYWLGTLYNDSSVTGVYILLAAYTGQGHPEKQDKSVRFLMAEQGEDGGWEQYPGSGGNLDVTLINTTALHVAGVPPDHEVLRRAHAFIRENGGTKPANFFTKIFLAMFGQIPWDEIPWGTCRLIHSQDIIYHQGFPRVILIPYMVLYENRRVMNLPMFFAEGEAEPSPALLRNGERFRKEKSPASFMEKFKEPEYREQCIRWILERQEKDGTWAGVVQATAFSAMALQSCDREEFADVIRQAVRGVESYQVESERGIMQPFSQGPVMDTAHSLRALLMAGIHDRTPAVQRAVRWLLEQQSLREGDWKYGNPEGDPGGWPFEFSNSWYPDVDDTAMVLTGLCLLSPSSQRAVQPAVDRGFRWMVSMQNRDGGFPVWDKNNWIIFNLLKSLFDVGDYSHADVTARVLVALDAVGNLGPSMRWPEIDDAIRSARSYLFKVQEENGSWYGRWGANYTYGTGQVLEGLLLTGSSPDDKKIRKAVDWLFQVQNLDGGWGESLSSYDSGKFEPGESTVAQTGAVLSGLLHAGVREDPRFQKGIRYLLDSQQPDGSWQDRLFYAVNVPRAWYGRYELLSTQAALMVLAAIRDHPAETQGVPGDPRGKETPR